MKLPIMNNKYIPNRRTIGDVIGELRIVPKGGSVWSISNQMNMILTQDVLVEINNTCYNIDLVFCKPKQVLFEGSIVGEAIIGLGSDVYSLDYNITKKR